MKKNQADIRDMLGRQKLTPVSEARELLLSRLVQPEVKTERLHLTQALDRVLAAEVISPEDLPPRDRSTMDGYAVIAADTFGASSSMPAYLEISGEVLMGLEPPGSLQRGSCFKIPTGGILPDGADAVQMFEQTVPVDDHLIEVVKPVGSGGNIIRRGDDIRCGDSALTPGHRLRPQDLGLLAGLGIAEVSVFSRPRVGIVSTGDEIVDFEAPVPPGKIRNINSITLACSAARAGAESIDFGIAADSETDFFKTLEKAVAATDLVIFSGGSSVGIQDLGERAIGRLGDPGLLVHGVALKPGKPILIGLCGNKPVFGLPGHPVSALVCFDLFVAPALGRLAGLSQDQPFRPSVRAQLQRSLNSAAGRLDLIRVALTRRDNRILAVPVLGRSGAISTLSRAHGYFLIDEESQGYPEGQEVEVFLYQ